MIYLHGLVRRMDSETNVVVFVFSLLVSLLRRTELDVLVNVTLILDAEHLSWKPFSLS